MKPDNEQIKGQNSNLITQNLIGGAKMARIKSSITILIIILLVTFIGGPFTDGNAKISYNLFSKADYLNIDRQLDLVQIQILQLQMLYLLLREGKQEKPVTFNPILYYDRNRKLITVTIFVDEEKFRALAENERKIELNDSIEMISKMIKGMVDGFETEKDLRVEFISFKKQTKLGEFYNGNLWLLLK